MFCGWEGKRHHWSIARKNSLFKRHLLYTQNTKLKRISEFQAHGRMLFQKFEKTIIFDEQMRQIGEDQKQFNELLNRVSAAETTLEDWQLLKTRELTGDGNIPPEEQEIFWKRGKKICACKKYTKEYNQQRICDLDQPIAKIKSENKPLTVEQFNLTVSEAKGLPPIIWLAKGSKVKLTINTFKPAGLTNGAVGTVEGIIYEERSKPQDLPSMVIVNFPDYIGKLSYKGMDRCWPVIPLEREWVDHRGKRHWRKMLPLTEAYASTIHSVQGMSISDPVIICLEALREFAEGLVFTALSRVRKFDQLSFHPKVPDYKTWFKGMKKREKVRDRLAHEKKEKESDANFNINLD